MAEITSERFLDEASAPFGAAEDSTRGVRDRVRGMVAQMIKLEVSQAQNTLTDNVTDALADKALAVGGGRVQRVFFVGNASATVSSSDNFTIDVLMRKAPSYSLTFNIATITSTAALWTPNGIGRVIPLAVPTTTDNIDVNDLNSFSYVITKNQTAGAVGHDCPEGAILIEVR